MFSIFFHENDSTKAAKRKGSWAHQQIDKTTPSTIGSLSRFSAHVFPCTGLWKLLELGEGVGCKFPWNQLQPINGYKRCCKFDKEDHYCPRFDADASG